MPAPAACRVGLCLLYGALPVVRRVLSPRSALSLPECRTRDKTMAVFGSLPGAVSRIFRVLRLFPPRNVHIFFAVRSEIVIFAAGASVYGSSERERGLFLTLSK